jgi:UPF0755 protein
MKKLIGRLASLVMILAIAFAAYEAYLKKPSSGAERQPVTLGKDLSTDEVASALKEAGIISSASLFKAIAGLSGAWRDFRPGTFVLKEGMSVMDALRTLSFKGPEEISVTIPEGYGLREIAERLSEAKVIGSPADLYAVTGEPGKATRIADGLVKDYPFLASKPEDVSLEGYMFPDTYRFFAQADSTSVVRRFLDNYKDKASGLSPIPDHRDLTVASLVEAEVRDSADRAKVAYLISRRLFLGMPLQFDSTVNYVTGKSDPAITFADRDVRSPWNTYANKGLPPGPIMNPGISSLKAALAPTPNPYLYFLTTPEGAVIYSKTLEEHNAAKAKYLK